MNKLNYLKKTVETYVVVDPNTRGEFKITVTEGVGDIHFEMEHSRVMSSEGVGASIELLKQLIQNDCFNPIARDGEPEGKKRLKPKKISKEFAETLTQFKKSPYVPDLGPDLSASDKGEAA